jgi:hypothetical protein
VPEYDCIALGVNPTVIVQVPLESEAPQVVETTEKSVLDTSGTRLVAATPPPWVMVTTEVWVEPVARAPKATVAAGEAVSRVWERAVSDLFTVREVAPSW